MCENNKKCTACLLKEKKTLKESEQFDKNKVFIDVNYEADGRFSASVYYNGVIIGSIRLNNKTTNLGKVKSMTSTYYTLMWDRDNIKKLFNIEANNSNKIGPQENVLKHVNSISKIQLNFIKKYLAKEINELQKTNEKMKNQLKEGTWALEVDKIGLVEKFFEDLLSGEIKPTINLLNKFKNKFWNIIGDDVFYDRIDSAITLLANNKSESIILHDLGLAQKRLQSLLAHQRQQKNESASVLPDGSAFFTESASEVLEESVDDKKYYKHIKDIDEVRPRFLPTPKPTGGSSKKWGLYIQDEASDIMIDKYGFDKGYKMWEGSIGQGGAMYQIAERIVREKGKMIDDLGIFLKGGYFERSYLDIWKEWLQKTQPDRYKKLYGSTKTDVVVDSPEENKNNETTPIINKKSYEIKFSDKDEQRIKDIVKKSNDDLSKKISLANAMANAIGSEEKLDARYAAAMYLGEKEIANVFLKKKNN